MSDSIQKIVAEGSWLYDGICEKPVYIIEQNYDYWFEMEKADAEIEPGEEPELNEDGLIYYVRFAPLGSKPWGVQYGGHKTIDKAKSFAVEKANGPISWK